MPHLIVTQKTAFKIEEAGLGEMMNYGAPLQLLTKTIHLDLWQFSWLICWQSKIYLTGNGNPLSSLYKVRFRSH